MIQSVRIVLLQVLLQVSEKAMLYHSFLLIPIGIVMILIHRPSLNDLGLGYAQMKRGGKRGYVFGGILIVVLTLLTPSLWMEPGLITIISSLETVIIYPVFEELLFRGYLWNKLEKRFENRKYGSAKMIALNTLLFGLWHLGYLDVIYMRTHIQVTSTSFEMIMIYKVLTGMVFGVLTSIARWRMKSTYSSLLVHSFLNIFGR
jgi:membrane protease YdiL (CAAX protease family)